MIRLGLSFHRMVGKAFWHYLASVRVGLKADISTPGAARPPPMSAIGQKLTPLRS